MGDAPEIVGFRPLFVKRIKCAKGHSTYYVSKDAACPTMSAYEESCPHAADGQFPIGRIPICAERITDWEMAKAEVVA